VAIMRPKPEEIVVKFRQVEVLMGQGMFGIDAIRQISVTEQTYSALAGHIFESDTLSNEAELCMSRLRMTPRVFPLGSLYIVAMCTVHIHCYAGIHLKPA